MYVICMSYMTYDMYVFDVAFLVGDIFLHDEVVFDNDEDGDKG